MEEGGIALMAMAFVLGAVHALDADHIVAVTGLACDQRPERRRARRYALQWAAGHGVVVLLIGAGVLLLGAAIPVELSHWAETLVGVMLLLIGIGVLRDLQRRRLRLNLHHHRGMPPHLHWRRESRQESSTPPVDQNHGHRPLLVGVVHGAAGSAPLLALLPLTVQQTPWVGMGYLLLFGLGVLAAMLLFGGVLGWLLGRVVRRTQRAANALWLLVGSFSTLFGGWLLYGAV